MTTSITDALRQVIGDEAYERAAAANARRTYDPRDNLDEATLRRSRIAPVSASMSYRRAVDMPREPWVDELAVATGDYREEWDR